MQRDTVSKDTIKLAFEVLQEMYKERLAKHGEGAFVSNHEALGVVAEEYDELMEAVRYNNDRAVFAELRDVAVAALHGMVSMMKEERHKEPYTDRE